MSIKKEKRGFTLIELLVVIAIIGILAGIVLVSLGGARNSAYDAEIKSELHQIRADSEVYYLNNGSYSNYSIPSNIKPPSCTGANDYSMNTDEQNQKIAFYSKLCSNNNNYWCVDSTGAAKTSTTTPATNSGTCP